MAIGDKFTAIANAIRGKTGGVDELTLDRMAIEISSISGGVVYEDTLLMGTRTDYINPRVTTIPAYGFYYNGVLEHINLPNVTHVGARAFYFSAKPITVKIPSVVELGEYAFSNATSLEEFSAPLLTTLGGSGCFSKCTSLKTVSLPLLTSVEGNTFEKCTNLTNIYAPNMTTLKGSVFRDCSALTALDVSKVTTISGMYVFKGCSGLSHLDFKSLTGRLNSSSGFDGCTGLKAIVFRSETLISLTSDSFKNSGIANGTGYIYVPDSLVEEYKAATNWSNYANQIKPLSEYVEVTE